MQKPQCLPKRHSTHLIYLFSNREAPKKIHKLLLIALIFHFCRPLQNILGTKIGIVWRKKKECNTLILYHYLEAKGAAKGLEAQGHWSPRGLHGTLFVRKRKKVVQTKKLVKWNYISCLFTLTPKHSLNLRWWVVIIRMPSLEVKVRSRYLDTKCSSWKI